MSTQDTRPHEIDTSRGVRSDTPPVLNLLDLLHLEFLLLGASDDNLDTAFRLIRRERRARWLRRWFR